MCKTCKKKNDLEFQNVEFKNHTLHTQARCKECGRRFYVKYDPTLGAGVPSDGLKRQNNKSISSVYR